MLERRPGETAFEYHRRLIYGKLVDKTLADVDYTELAPYVYGQDYSADVVRRMMYGSAKTLQLADEAREADTADTGGDALLTELDTKKIELQKERQRFWDQRNAFNKLVRERARQEELNDIIIRTVREGGLPALEYTPCEPIVSDNDLLVSLNDIHYGAYYKNHWYEYTSEITAMMIRKYIDRIIQISKTHHSENCIVWANGDLISGSIHHSIQVTNRETIIEQIMGVSELIAEMLAELSKHFTSVRYVSVSGNHSRIDHKDRALMSERLDDLVEWYLAARLAGFRNIEIGFGKRIDPSMYIMDVRGLKYVGVHGDYDPSPQHIQALQTMMKCPVHAVLMAHRHHNKTDIVQGVRVIMGGGFLGMDDHCVAHRIYGHPEQIVCVCDSNGIMCHYDVDLSV